MAPAEDENGNVWLSRAIGFYMIKEYEANELSLVKQGETLEYQ